MIMCIFNVYKSPHQYEYCMYDINNRKYNNSFVCIFDAILCIILLNMLPYTWIYKYIYIYIYIYICMCVFINVYYNYLESIELHY